MRAHACLRAHTHTHTHTQDASELCSLEMAPILLLGAVESHKEAEVAHKQLALLGLERADFDRLQGLLSPRDAMEWPEDLKDLDLSTEAGRERHVSALAALIDRFSIPPDQFTGRYVGSRLMHTAAGSGYLHIVAFLINKRADPAPVDMHGNTPLNDAIQDGHIDIVRYLTALGDEVNKRQLNATTKTGFTALAHAVTECRMWGASEDSFRSHCVRDYTEYDFSQETLSAGASNKELAATPIPFQMFKLLVDAGGDLNATSKSSGNILFKLLIEPRRNDDVMESESWLCVVMASRYLLLQSPRRCEVDLQVIDARTHRGGGGGAGGAGGARRGGGKGQRERERESVSLCTRTPHGKRERERERETDSLCTQTHTTHTHTTGYPTHTALQRVARGHIHTHSRTHTTGYPAHTVHQRVDLGNGHQEPHSRASAHCDACCSRERGGLPGHRRSSEHASATSWRSNKSRGEGVLG